MQNKPEHIIPVNAGGAHNPGNLDYRVDFIPLSNGDGTFDPKGFYPPEDSPIEFELNNEFGLILGYTTNVQIKIHQHGTTWSRMESCVIVYSTDRSKNGRDFKVYTYNDIRRWRVTTLAIPGFDT